MAKYNIYEVTYHPRGKKSPVKIMRVRAKRSVDARNYAIYERAVWQKNPIVITKVKLIR